MQAQVIDLPRSHAMSGDVAVIEHMLASGEIVAAQLPSYSNWTPEKKLAAAAFTSALLNVRDHTHSANRRHQRDALEDIAWIRSDDAEWPYSFVRMCELFGLDPAWVRRRVDDWTRYPSIHHGRRFSTHRHAA